LGQFSVFAAGIGNSATRPGVYRFGVVGAFYDRLFYPQR
jgi:hypothetical protein